MAVDVLLVDDQDDIRMLWRLYINGGGRDQRVVAEAASAAEALALDVEPDIWVVDQMMPDMTGIELVGALRDQGRNAPAILCSAFITDDVRARAREVGIAQCIDKLLANSLPEIIDEVLAAPAD